MHDPKKLEDMAKKMMDLYEDAFEAFWVKSKCPEKAIEIFQDFLSAYDSHASERTDHPPTPSEEP